MFEYLDSLPLEHSSPRPVQLADRPSQSVTAGNDLDDCDCKPFEIVRSSRQLVHILHQAAAARLTVTLGSPHLASGMPTRLLGTDAASGTVYIRQLCNDQVHATLVSDRHFNLLVRQDESTVLLSLTIDRLGTWNRQDCYIARLPAWALSSQMRACQRIHLRKSMSLTLRHRFPDNDSLEAKVTDISEGGLCLVVPHLPLRGIRQHERWQQARIAHGEMEIGPLVLQVRHFRNETGSQRIGLSIENTCERQMHCVRNLLSRLRSPGH